LKSRFTERVVERGLPISDRGNIRANLLRLPQGLGLRKQPPNSRLLQALKSLTFKATPLCLLASFLFDKFRFPLDHPFTIVLGARTAHSLTVNHDRNRDIRELSLQGKSVSVGPRLDRLISTAQGHQLATHRTAHALRRRRRCLHRDSVERESDAEVADVGHKRPRLSAIDRYADVQPIKSAQKAVKNPKATFLEASFEHRVVKSWIRPVDRGVDRIRIE